MHVAENAGEGGIAKQMLCHLSYTPIETRSLGDRNLVTLRILLSAATEFDCSE